MALNTLKELRDNIATTIRDTQIGSLLDSYLNLTLQEIANADDWSWLRRKATLSVSTEDAYLDEEVDRLLLVRQTDSPVRLTFVPDQLFYKYIPNPTATGNPRYYRLWEESGISTQISATGTVYAKSSSTSDGSSFTLSVVGRDANGLVITEILTLNGTTAVTSSTSFASILDVSKSANTTGTITLYETTGDVVLACIAPNTTSSRHKHISFYPIPTSATTIYLEYIERVRLLVNASDIPQLPAKWLWVLREGALAKAQSYKQNEEASQLAQKQFEKGLVLMRRQDGSNSDYIPTLERRYPASYSGPLEVADRTYALTF